MVTIAYDSPSQSQLQSQLQLQQNRKMISCNYKFTFLVLISLSYLSSIESFCTKPLFTASSSSGIVSSSLLTQRIHSNPRPTTTRMYSSYENDKLDYEEEERTPQHTYFATCIPGLSSTLAYEISTILPHLNPEKDIQIQGNSGVSFTTSSPKDGLKALYWLRTAHRLLQLICTNNPSSSNPADTYDNTFDGDDDEERYFPISDRHDLYDFIRLNVNVPSLLGDGKGGILSLSCKCLSSSSSTNNLPQDLNHLHYTALTVKNALVDECRDLHPQNIRPDVNTVDPDVPLFLAITGTPPSSSSSSSSSNAKNNRNNNNSNRGEEGVTVSLYRCLNNFKQSLHKRGYRYNNAIHKAAMKESLAAGLLYTSGFDKLMKSTQKGEGKAVLLDPMMGSGTFLMEAAYLASDVAPGLLREKFVGGQQQQQPSYNDYDSDNLEEEINIGYPPVLRWKDTDLEDWKQVRLEAKERAIKGRQWLLQSCQTGEVVMQGNEMDPRAFTLAQKCFSTGGLSQMITLSNQDCVNWEHVKDIVVDGRSMVVTNPPWGLRLNNDNNYDNNDSYIVNAWESLATFLKRECSGVEAWILSGNKNLTKLLRMKKTRGIPIHTGDEDLRWIQYHIFDWKRDGSFGDKGTSAKVQNARAERAKKVIN